MLHKTRGIVFKYFKYRESSIIVKIFTEAFGMQSYIVNGVRSSKSSRSKMALFQPLTLLDLIVYHKPGGDINRIAETRCSYPFKTLATDIKKLAIAIFVSEVLYKSVREEGEDHPLFDFVFNSIEILDYQESGYENFHLRFLLKLSKYLGFGIENSTVLEPFDEEEAGMLKDLMEKPYDAPVPLTNLTRRVMLEHIIKFYQANVDSLKEINSIKVLQEVF